MPATIPATILRIATLATLALAAVLPASAQDSQAKSAKVEFRVTRFDPGDRPSPKFRAGAGEAKTDIEVPLTHIEGPFKADLRDDKFLDLWGDSLEKPEISVEIKPTEREHLLLVFFPEGTGFRVLKVLASPTRIKGGDRFVINTTQTEIAIKLGDAKPLVVPSAQTGLLAGPSGNKIVSLPVVINHKEDGGWKLTSTEDWPCDPRFRKYIIAYVSPRSRQLMFHSVSELAN